MKTKTTDNQDGRGPWKRFMEGVQIINAARTVYRAVVWMKTDGFDLLRLILGL